MTSRFSREQLELVYQAVSQYHGFVYKLAFRILRHQADAEDVTQIVFLRLVGSLDAFSQVESQKAWLARVTLRESLTWIRSEVRRRRRERNWAMKESQRKKGEVMKATEEVSEAVSSLPDMLRLPVVLHYQDGLKFREIAAACGCSVGTIASRISTARNRLKTKLRMRPFHGLYRGRPALRKCLFLLALLSFTIGRAWSQPDPSFEGLGDLPGGEFFSLAWDVSADGSVVTGYSISNVIESKGNSFPLYEAFRWTEAEGMIGLGSLPGGEYPFSEAIGLSFDGSVIVGHTTSGSSVSSEAFRWSHGKGMMGLGFLPGSSTQSWAYGVSSDGSVVVGFGFSGEGTQAFRWTEAEGMVGLGDLPGGKFSSRAWDASLHGEVIVGASASSEGIEAFRWTGDEGMVGMGFLSREGSPEDEIESEAYAVSADGATIVGDSHSAFGQEAFRWTRTEGMMGLGDLPGGEHRSAARGVSADGSVVVGVGTTSLGEEAFLWDAQHGMRNLREVLQTDLGIDLSDWKLLIARRVSDDGRVIVGDGISPGGEKEAFRATLMPSPPPAGPRFRRGDCNGDGTVAGQVTDAVYLLAFNFLGGPEPPCLAACDANGDGRVQGQVGDAIYLLTHNFLGGPAPVEPFPGCGPGLRPNDKTLGCENPKVCQ
jgi:RNA polymerase sigma factor (sigma-70 family)